MSLLDNFPHKCRIQRRVRAKDTLGGSKDSVEIEQTDVVCWEQQASFSETKEFEKKGIKISKKIYFRTDPEVTERHQILITYRNGATVSSPETYDVMSHAVPDASAGLGVVFKVMVALNLGATK